VISLLEEETEKCYETVFIEVTPKKSITSFPIHELTASVTTFMPEMLMFWEIRSVDLRKHCKLSSEIIQCIFYGKKPKQGDKP
jgi:hypothetical protein